MKAMKKEAKITMIGDLRRVHNFTKLKVQINTKNPSSTRTI